MLADWGMAVTHLYGVHNPDRNAPNRAAFVIDRDGVLRFINAAFDARDPGHYVQIIEQLQELP
jgi:alkyl hydroperoxide reductase subunit AhpC